MYCTDYDCKSVCIYVSSHLIPMNPDLQAHLNTHPDLIKIPYTLSSSNDSDHCFTNYLFDW